MCECERVEVVVYRDPDGTGDVGTNVTVFCDGELIPDAQVTVVDPGAGYTVEDWAESAEAAVRGASAAAAELIGQFYEDGAETEFIS